MSQKITISEPTSKWSDAFPQDNAPPAAPLQTKKEPVDAIIYQQTSLFERTPSGFKPRNAAACKIFPGSIAEFDAYQQRLRDEAEAAKAAARQAAREAAERAAAAEPKPPPGILPSSENMTIKRDPYAINDIVVADDDAWKELVPR